MKHNKYKLYLISILLTLAVGGLGGIVTMRGMPAYQRLVSPLLTPPSVLFPIVWSILFLLMGWSAARIWTSQDPHRRRAQFIYIAQLGLNVLWCILFFGFGARLAAFFCLLLLLAMIAEMIRVFYPIDPTAAYLQLPYFFWVLFAGYLNAGFWWLNRSF